MAQDSKHIALTRSLRLSSTSCIRRYYVELRIYGFDSDAQLSTTPQLELAFEHLLRNSAVDESVISILRVNEVVDRDTFVNMFDTETALKDGAADREFARVVTAWKTAKVMAETKLQTDAVAKAHGVPTTLLPCDWTSILVEFKEKFGSHISEERLPAQSMFDNFSEKACSRRSNRIPRNLIMSKLTITTKRRHLSTDPVDEKGLRLKYAILTNLWPLAQMRQPGRSIFQDLDISWTRFSTIFNFYKEVDGRSMISLCWSFCVSFEFELRKEAIRLCKEEPMEFTLPA